MLAERGPWLRPSSPGGCTTLTAMQPEIHVFGISIKTFGICFAVGFLAAGAVIARRLKELGKPVDWAYEIVFAALLGGLIGARLYFVVQNYDEVKGDLLGNVFGGSGLVWYGGAIGGAIGVLLWAHWRGMVNLDAARPVLGAAGARLRDRPHRLPGVGRRRLRDPVERAVGDGLPARHGADEGQGPPDADLRDADHVPARVGAVGSARPLPARRDLRPLPRRRRARALPRRVHPSQRRGVCSGLTAPQLESVAMFVGGGIWLWVLVAPRWLVAAGRDRLR